MVHLQVKIIKQTNKTSDFFCVATYIWLGSFEREKLEKYARIQDGSSGRKVVQRLGVLTRKLVEESAILQYLLCWGKAMG